MHTVKNDDGSLLVKVFAGAIEKLAANGYDALSDSDKNDLIITIANKEGILLNDVTPAYILQYHKNIKIAELNQTCDNTICAGFTASNGHVYRTNRDDQTNMIGQKDELNDDTTITTVKWKTEDAGYIDHTRDEWLQIYSEAFSFKKQQLFKYDSLKKTVTDATDHPSIISVNWS